jgi:DNA-directed RNA polymerase subunit RPC12/RpoP
MVSMPRLGKGAEPPEGAAGMLIGDSPQGAYVSCPRCGRPVADGLVRCAGCGMRILMGVAASRALLFLTTGAVLGLLVGGISVVWITGLSHSPAPTQVPAIVVPGSPGAGASAPIPSASAENVDPLAASALRQIASTNDQLAGSLATLKHELKASSVDTGAMSATLRQMSAAATYGASVVGYLSAWPEAAPLQASVGRLYAQIRSIAANGLSLQLAAKSGYAAAGRQMVLAMAVLPSVQSDAFKLAASAGMELPGQPTPAPSREPSLEPSPAPSPSPSA